MKGKKTVAVTVALRSVSMAVFIMLAIYSVGSRLPDAIGINSKHPHFATLSALSTPRTVTQQTLPDEGGGEEANTGEQAPTEEEEEFGSKIIPVELSLSDGSKDILFKNETKYTFDTGSLLKAGYPIDPIDDEPSVLVLHTHATESYAEEGASTVTDTRSKDPEKNMVAVGKALTEELKRNGVSAIHCTVMHDSESYNDSYPLSADSVKEYLKKYPSIKYILDVHRDAISMEDGAMAKPVIEKDGISLAQMMLVVGTDEGGADHPGWKTNLCVAVRTQEALIDYDESLPRPVNLRVASFNQQLSPGFLLLEIGSCANTLTEAKASAGVFAQIFAELIKNP